MKADSRALTAIPLGGGWEGAACASHPDPDIWFPETQMKHTSKSRDRAIVNTARALAICFECPIQRKCLEVGMQEENVRHGIWGGTFASERAKALKWFYKVSDIGLEMRRRLRKYYPLPDLSEFYPSQPSRGQKT